MGTEKLKFKLELYAIMWDKPPHVEISVGEKVYFEDDIKGTEDTPSLIDFEIEAEESQSYDLLIKRSGKNKYQTVVENGEIVKDQLLCIKRVEIDGIDIGPLVYEGLYTPEYPEPWASQQREKGIELQESFKNVTQMGFNGEWRITFASPFYMWLLENLY